MARESTTSNEKLNIRRTVRRHFLIMGLRPDRSSADRAFKAEGDYPMMKYDFVFKHMNTSEAVVTYVEEVMEKLHKYEMKPVHAHWVFSVQRHEHTAEIILTGPQVRFQAKATASDMYEAVDLALSKVAKQLAKKKAKVTDHKGMPKAG
ncbi:MAG: ribosome-associated translation inhibitor RaiA [Bdellovibrionia bacterium]